MEDIPETYNLETLEQLRAVADKLRVRILQQLTPQAMTVTQLAGALGEVPARLHYHVHELEKVGLLKLVETREKGGILEKYYRAVAKHLNVPATLFHSAPPDEVMGTLNEIIQPLLQGFFQAAQHMLRTQTWDDPDQVLLFSPEHYWMTGSEFVQVSQQIADLLKLYKERRSIEGEREQALLWIGYTIAPSGSQAENIPPAAPSATPATKPKREIFMVAGITHYGRQDLEKLIAGGAVLDMRLLGGCIFADDVTPDLVERAVHSFHLWGKLNASPEVREVLKRKGGESSKKTNSGA